MSEESMGKEAAQRRADRIRGFREELEEVEAAGALALTPEQRTGLHRYHDGLLERLQSAFDVDVSDAQRQMSWGMRIASGLGALAMAAAVYFFFYRFWGLMSTPLQVVILVLGPVLAVAAMEAIRRIERTLYFTSLLGLVAFACFVLNLVVLGAIFNLTPSENAFLAWGAFGVILAYAYGLRLLLFAGLVSLLGYLMAKVGVWSGCYWLHLGTRPENFVVSGLAIAAAPLIIRHRRRPAFAGTYRLAGLLAVFLAVLVLSHWGGGSYLRLTPEAVEILYQCLGLLLAGLAIWGGIRFGWKETVYVGSTFFVVFLYTRLFDWWWDLMPKYLFFLILGLVAVGLLVILRLARSVIRGEAS